MYSPWAQFLMHGVDHSLRGVRTDADLASKFANQDTVVYVAKKGKISLP